MNTKEMIEIAKKSNSIEDFTKKVDYTLGRNEAMRDIADGTPDICAAADLSAHFSAEWIRGYREYISAWKVLNQPA